MKIFVYWNYKDQDSKKIYQFIKQSSFFENLEKEHQIFWHKEYKDFPVDDTLKEHLQESDIIFFFTHGEDDRILKFRYNNELVKDRFTFISYNNARLLSEKKIFAFCCRSANELGEYCVGFNVNSIFYIGFMDDLVYSDECVVSGEFKSTIYKAYSAAFEKALTESYEYKWTVSRFVFMLKKYINDMLTEEILS